MTRRVLRLLLACQLLLVQGQLCGSCPASGGQPGHAAGQPHIHTSRFIPGPASDEPMPNRCRCCQRRAEPTSQVAVARARDGSPRPSSQGDAVYLPTALVADEAHRSQPRFADLPLGPSDFAVGAFVAAPPECWPIDTSPPAPPGGRPAPIYLLNLALLI